MEEISSPRPLYSPHIDYSEETRGELAIFFAAFELRARYGAAALPNAIISKTDGVPDLLEVALLLKEAGLLVPAQASGGEPVLAMNIIPLFETIADLRNCPVIMRRLFALPQYQVLVKVARRGARGHARLLRFQQGWRFRRRVGSFTRLKLN